jgi:hypothetical protein
MPEYEYQGPGPHEEDDGTIVRPGDVREFDTEPDGGPWRLIEAGEPAEEKPPLVITPDGPQKPAAPAASQPPAPAPASPPAASTAAPAPKQGE